MKARLMHPDRNFDPQRLLPDHAPDLQRDLALDALARAMAANDEFVFEVARKALLLGTTLDIDTVVYRQEIVRDAIAHPQVARRCYVLVTEAIEGKRKSHWAFSSNYPSSILHGAIDVLTMFVDILRKLRGEADTQGAGFGSRGFRALFAMLQAEFTDDYLAQVSACLSTLKLDGGVQLSAQLGSGNEGKGYTLREVKYSDSHWMDRLFSRRTAAGYTFRIADRDEAGARALSDLRHRGINDAANALAQSMDHILAFFEMLRTELAFHVGCVNLHERLAALGVPTCFPQPSPTGMGKLRFENLSDPCLALSMGGAVVGNALDLGGKRLTIVTGANQGGKSSFLRSLGLAQAMMQSGMYVAASSFAGDLCAGLFTHYRREEDPAMRGGRLDEELQRLSAMVNELAPGAMILFNESFASTNEREGSEIATETAGALRDRGIRVFFVTHLYGFAHGFFAEGAEDVACLRAERLPDGRRSFRIVVGPPLETSHGEDVYREVFGDHAAAPP
ncbi:hypothetical protein ASG87_05715 [Frateuria sp. Soil773]|uniref:MutS-related protein n=1 Tax=Frateuria sp. Soil773 TaxID=1736407 RepID=UPI0006F2D997|nr:hypothetical protein [Frateuria sp. Soil773]KRE89215.1 hypothetical protein ASG87_05715 [Frateuria sp. Soil773]